MLRKPSGGLAAYPVVGVCRLLFAICLCLSSFVPRAASAGYYCVGVQSQTGSVTVTPSGGSPTTTSLDNSSGTFTCDPMEGTVSYSYSVTGFYEWIEDYQGGLTC